MLEFSSITDTLSPFFNPDSIRKFAIALALISKSSKDNCFFCNSSNRNVRPLFFSAVFFNISIEFIYYVIENNYHILTPRSF